MVVHKFALSPTLYSGHKWTKNPASDVYVARVCFNVVLLHTCHNRIQYCCTVKKKFSKLHFFISELSSSATLNVQNKQSFGPNFWGNKMSSEDYLRFLK